MKQILSITILFVAMMLLNSCATTPEPAKATTAQTSPTVAQSTANAEQEIIKLEKDFGALTAENGVAFMERAEANEYLYTRILIL